jgi:uncharacterized protein (TIGR00725 family)
LGILPDDNAMQASVFVRIPICTGMGSGRNIINVLSSDFVIACSGGAGTISEIALALKHGKIVFTVAFSTGEIFAAYQNQGKLLPLETPEQAITKIKNLVASKTLIAGPA